MTVRIFHLQTTTNRATVTTMNREGASAFEYNDEPVAHLPLVALSVESPIESRDGEERFGEAMLQQMEIADTRLDIEGTSRFGESWGKALTWAKEGWEWAKRPSETYAEAVGKAALFSAGTTVFLAPIFLYRNCKQVYDARARERKSGNDLEFAST